jgi:hypothetical protein
MKSILLVACLAAVSAASVSSGCSPAKDNDKDSGGSSSGASKSTGGDEPSAGESNGPGSSAGGSDSSGGAVGAGQGEGGAEYGTGSPKIESCSTGQLLLGDPLYNDKPDAGSPKPAGQGRLDDPPIRGEAMAVIGSKLFIETEFELWSVDLSDPSSKLSRFAGKEGNTFIDAGGACKDASFLVIRDMTATPDGKLAVVDYVGGAIIEISDPGGPNCKADWVAGTHTKTDDPGDDYPLAQGDMDGPGASALFGGDKAVTGIGGAGIHKITSDLKGNLYTWDEGTGKFKKIANDKDRTVSTIGVGATDDNVMGLAWLGGKLYATGVDGSNDFLKEIDPTKYDPQNPKANVVDVFRNRDQFSDAGVESGHQAVISQVYSDGEALIISGQSGFVWRVAADGTVLATLAGSGPFLDYENGFDPLVSHPAKDWQLVHPLSNHDGGPWLALAPGRLYWEGGIGIGKYALEFTCK